MSEADRYAPRPPILLLHGIFSKPAFLRPWVERLDAAGFDCHAPALPGREPTDEALLARSGVAEYYEVALAAYDALARPPIVIGHSLGGLLGQKLAAARPCAALVLLASVPPGILWAQPVAMPHLARLFPAIVKGRAVLPSAETLRAIPLHGLPRQEQDEVIAEMVPDSGRAFRDLTMGAPVTRVDAAAVDCPVLCVSAGADRNVSARASAAIAKRYDAPHTVHPGLPHWIIAASALERVAPPVLDWLDERFPA